VIDARASAVAGAAGATAPEITGLLGFADEEGLGFVLEMADAHRGT
jgi:hypothetical protein